MLEMLIACSKLCDHFQPIRKFKFPHGVIYAKTFLKNRVIIQQHRLNTNFWGDGLQFFYILMGHDRKKPPFLQLQSDP